jgi:acylphosphatase
MSEEQRIVTFRGDVQGVGFRYTACRVAGQYDVAGAVRNCRDGTVECVVEGDVGEIDAFLDELREAMRSYIRETHEEIAPATGRYTSFGVAF